MKAIAMNEEQGGFQQLTGFSRKKENRKLGGDAMSHYWDGVLGDLMNKLGGEGTSEGTDIFIGVVGGSAGILVNVSGSTTNSDGSKSNINQTLVFGQNTEGSFGFFDSVTGIQYDAEKNNYVKELLSAFNYLISGGAGIEVLFLMASKEGILIEDAESASVKGGLGPEFLPVYNLFNRSGHYKILWNPFAGSYVIKNNLVNGIQSPALLLLHEIGHANAYMRDINSTNQRKTLPTWGPEIGDYDDFEEMRVIKYVETPAAIRLGEPIRTNHRGGLTVVPNSIFHIKY